MSEKVMTFIGNKRKAITIVKQVYFVYQLSFLLDTIIGSQVNKIKPGKRESSTKPAIYQQEVKRVMYYRNLLLVND